MWIHGASRILAQKGQHLARHEDELNESEWNCAFDEHRGGQVFLQLLLIKIMAISVEADPMSVMLPPKSAPKVTAHQ